MSNNLHFTQLENDKQSFYCSICLEDKIRGKNKVSYGECTHSNCQNCVRKMLIKNCNKCKLTCPECRTEIIELQIVDTITFISLAGKGLLKMYNQYNNNSQ